MFSEAELSKAISEIEKSSATYQDAEKLATFYILYDHLYKKEQYQIEQVREVTIDRYDGSEFYRVISDKNARFVWEIMNETMEILKVAQPEIYNAVISRLIKI